MRLTVLGSGSPEAYARRASSGHLVEAAGKRILLDCGGGVFDRLLRLGVGPSEIDALILSHLHSDHMMDYARLVHARWDEGGPPLPVYGPAPIGEITRRLFGPEGAFAFDLAARCDLQGSREVWQARGGALPRPWPAPEVHEIGPGARIEGDGWRAETCEALHAQPHLTCLGIAIEAEGRRLVYSGDAGITPQMEAFCSGADLLLHWCYRIEEGSEVSEFMRRTCPVPSEIAAMAERAGARRLVLTHLRRHMDAPERLAEARRQLAAFPGPAAIAEDLDGFDLG